MIELFSVPDWDDSTKNDDPDETPENLKDAERLATEYHTHMRRQIGRVARRKPIEEVTQEFRGVLAWLRVENLEMADDKSVKSSNEVYLDYSAYDVEDTFFIVYDSLNGRRSVRVEDIITEHEETNLKTWQEKQTKQASSFLIIHGADEKQINKWKSVEGTARQQRAMRRMYWLLQQPFMQQFKDFLRQRATTEKPYEFKELVLAVENIIIDGQRNLSIQQQNRDLLIPRKQEELDDTAEWLTLAMNICNNVFDLDIEDGVYGLDEAEKSQT